jgi:acyl carrier protein
MRHAQVRENKVNKSEIIEIMRESADSLHRSKMLETKLDMAAGTLLFGEDSPLDSLGFVTFVTEVEDRLNQKTGKDLVIAVLEIDGFDENQPQLTVDKLADYLVKLTNS